ncbi:MAG: GNAT family N-acetyltransferase [bacterium]|nr:GNAT family N-acetyltransferase [bacterium]
MTMFSSTNENASHNRAFLKQYLATPDAGIANRTFPNKKSKLAERFPQEILTQRLRLRPLTPGDAGEVLQLLKERDIPDASSFFPYPNDYHTVEQWLVSLQAEQQRGSSLYLAIELKTRDLLMGAISLIFVQEQKIAEIGFRIGEAYRGKGYCAEAVAVVLEYGFAELKLERIRAFYLKSNHASARVLEKTGMKYEGCIPNHYKKKDTFEDVCIRGILKEDFPGLL